MPVASQVLGTYQPHAHVSLLRNRLPQGPGLFSCGVDKARLGFGIKFMYPHQSACLLRWSIAQGEGSSVTFARPWVRSPVLHNICPDGGVSGEPVYSPQKTTSSTVFMGLDLMTFGYFHKPGTKIRSPGDDPKKILFFLYHL